MPSRQHRKPHPRHDELSGLKPADRVVVSLALTELWDERGPIRAEKQGTLESDAIKDLLRDGPARFVLANVGDKLKWLDKEECYTFWRDDAKHHLYNEAKPYLKQYPDEYFYLASAWQLDSGETIIVLEKHH